MGYFTSFRRRCSSAIQYDNTKEAYSVSRIGALFMFGKEMRKMANANVKITYIVICKNLDEAIDEKNKIIANTLDDEIVDMKHDKRHHIKIFKDLIGCLL